jgi:undecaprenyl-diphosphatase
VPAWIVDLFARYGYAVVFFGVFLENAGVPVPGETALLAGGALAHAGRVSLFWVIATAIGGATLGDNLGFWIGRRGGRALVERHGGRVGLTRKRLAHFDRFFRQHGAKTVFFARFITGLRVFCAVLAGGSAMSWRTFLFYNATGAIVWASVIGAAGYLLGRSWQVLERWIGRASLAGLAIVLVLAAIMIARRRGANGEQEP